MLLVSNSFATWLNKVPLLRLLVPLILGVVAYEYIGLFHVSTQTAVWLCIVSSFFVLLSFYFSRKNRITIWLFGIVAQTAIFVFGGVFTALKVQQWQQLPQTNKPLLVLAEVLDDPISKPKTFKTCLLVTQYKTAADANWQRTNVKLLAYFSKKSTASPQVGQRIVMAIKPQTIQQFKGATFDYPQYLARQYLYQQAFVAPQKWLVVDSVLTVRIAAQRAQKKLLTVFERLGFSGEELAVIAALTVGYKNLIDNDTQKAFAASGAMHILAVSGLHVGILFWILSKVLFFMDKRRTLAILKAILIVLIIWGYSFLAGMAPSIERAALMFTFITLAQITAREHTIFNILAASAFVIVVGNPYSVFDIGFQLSYLAIVGIVYFYPLIYRSIHIRWKIIDLLLWQTIASTIAALLVTLPITLYYFGIMPTWSLVTNLVGIPLSFLITIVIALALAVFPFWAWAAGWIGWLAERGTWLFNLCIHGVSKLPYAQVACKLSGVGLLVFYAVLLAVVVVIEEYRLRNNYKKISDLTD